MSSAYPTPSVEALVGLGLIGCDTEKTRNESPSQDTVSCMQPVDHATQEAGTARGSATEAPENAARCESVTARSAAEAVRPAEVSSLQAESPAKPVISQGVVESAGETMLEADSPTADSASDVPSVYHRIAQVRKMQGLTERTVAKRMGIDIRSYRQIECATTDLSLSQLAAAQKALEVPLIDLLEDNQALSRPVEERAKLVRTMKTAVAIREASGAGRIQRLSQMLCNQLTDLMPELNEVVGWPQFGARRGQSAIGRALAQPIDTSDLRGD